MLAPMPSAAEWAAKGLEKYGLVAVAKNGLMRRLHRSPSRVRARDVVASMASTRCHVAATPSNAVDANASPDEASGSALADAIDASQSHDDDRHQ